MTEKKFVCDPVTGTCRPADLGEAQIRVEKSSEKEIIYVGDPMCSWCWGISNHLKELKSNYPGFPFSIVLGGLRPGGGDPWNDEMKSFLDHHWKEVHKRSRQPFGDKLFQREHFNYDTEPACRAVVASRKWMGEYELDFYEAVSRKFYVENEDPGDAEFYKSICETFDIPFEEFMEAFKSEGIKKKTFEEFQLNRSWGVTGYPSVLFKYKEELYQISAGYSEFDQMKGVIEKILSEEKEAVKN